MRVIRCAWCGNTYSEQREWCPHCLAPRVVEESEPESDAQVFWSDNRDVGVFWSDNSKYYVETSWYGLMSPNEMRSTIPPTYGTVERK